MSWYPDLYIGELRPWPDAVYVWRGKTGESQRYLPDDFCALARENNELRELAQKMMRFFEDDDWCTICEVARECEAQEQYEEDCLMRGVFHNRIRELGIEVDA